MGNRVGGIEVCQLWSCQGYHFQRQVGQKAPLGTAPAPGILAKTVVIPRPPRKSSLRTMAVTLFGVGRVTEEPRIPRKDILDLVLLLHPGEHRHCEKPGTTPRFPGPSIPAVWAAGLCLVIGPS